MRIAVRMARSSLRQATCVTRYRFLASFSPSAKAAMMANVKNAKVKMEEAKRHGIAVWCLPHNNAASFGTENYTFTGWTG